MSKTQNEIIQICDSVRDLLLEKNRKYGDSALEPVRVMSRSTPVEQILVRIDDKLSRISRGTGLVGDDEDVITDLIGYFVLLKIALGRQNGEEVQVSDHVPFSVTYDDILKASRQDLEDRPLYSATVEYGQERDALKHSPYYYDRNRNRTYTEWYPEDIECGWDPNSGPTC